MKTKQFLLTLTGVLALVVLISCSKKDEAVPEPVTPPTTTTAAAAGTMKATVDGGTFNSIAMGTMAVYAGTGYQITGTIYPKSIHLSFISPKDLVVGTTYTFKNAGTNTGDAYANYDADSADSTKKYGTDATHTGILTITKYDAAAKKISGTFSFKAIQGAGPGTITGTETKDITSGSFTDVKTY